MCRILSYLGEHILLEELFYKSDNSFIKQSYHPKYMSQLLNLAGFGIAAWDNVSQNPDLPYIYKTSSLPFYDENLRNLSAKVAPHCLLAHLRGVAYSGKQVITIQNVHPFLFTGATVALAHNGSLYNFDKMKYDLLPFIQLDYQREIHGTTDSEWIYAIFLSQLPGPSGNYKTDEIVKAIIETLKILHRARIKNNIFISSPINLFISNGDFIAATRFVFDYGWKETDLPPSNHSQYHSLWYTYGERYGLFDGEYKMKGSKKKSSIILASEPLTQDTTTWIEVPEYSLIIARREAGEIIIVSKDINL